MAKKLVTSRIPEHEHIRVVPLHQPKTKVQLRDLSAPSELFSGKPHKVTGAPMLTYRGGPLLTNVEVFVVYWGRQFKDGVLSDLPKKIDEFYDDILDSPAIYQLAEYSIDGKVIGHGSRSRSVVITAGAPDMHIRDSEIRAQLEAWIAKNKKFPKPGKNTLYFIYFERGVSVSMGGAKSCTSFCGYHDAIRKKIFYAVMPYPSCDGCLGDMSAFEALCGTSTHELCEAITDPVPGLGWYNDLYGEIGDICAWNFKKVHGYTVQKEWSNKLKKCV